MLGAAHVRILEVKSDNRHVVASPLYQNKCKVSAVNPTSLVLFTLKLDATCPKQAFVQVSLAPQPDCRDPLA
jgi:hypothetical protein